MKSSERQQKPIENYYNYIHATKTNYMESIPLWNVRMDKIQAETQKAYKRAINRANINLQQINNSLGDGVELIDIVNQMNNYLKNPAILNEINEVDIKGLQQDTSTLNKSSFVSTFNEKTGDVKEQAKLLNDYIDTLESFLHRVDLIDNNLKTYYKQASSDQKKNINKVFGNKNLHVLRVNKSSMTAFENAKKELEALRKNQQQILANLNNIFTTKEQKDSGIQGYSITYTDSKGKKQTKEVQNVMGTITGQLSNIQGGIGEAIIGMFAIENRDKLISDFESDVLKNSNNGFILTSTQAGNSQLYFNEHTVTSKNDILLNFMSKHVKINSRGNSTEKLQTELSVGISVKNQLIGKMSTGDTKISQNRIIDLIMNVDEQYKYVFLNYLGLNGRKDYKNEIYNKQKFNEYYRLANQYIAAMNIELLTTGEGYVTKKGKNTQPVVLLAFMDQVITVNQIYEQLLMNPTLAQLKPEGYTSISKQNVPEPEGTILSLKDVSPNDKNAFSFGRSQKINDLLMDVKVLTYI